MGELAMITCLWFGFWCGFRHGKSKRTDISIQLNAAARKICKRALFVGDGAFVPTYSATLTCDGHEYTISMMQAKEGRSFTVCQVVP